MQLDDVVFPADPFSDAYRMAVLDLYEWLHGGLYEVSNEMTPFEMQAALAQPFPYLTSSPGVVGDYLIAIGHLVRTLDLGPGSRVLELGAGWGNVALPLARLGIEVTAVDVCPSFVELIRARAEREGLQVETRLADFSEIGELFGGERPFDAVVFFESFHHSADHNRLLRSLSTLVSRNGKLIFGAEPIERRFWQPWSLRLDGESLWAIRRNGWLELGFRQDYFLEALRRAGWGAQLVACPATRWGQVWVSTRL